MRYIIVIPANKKGALNQYSKATYDKKGGEKTFTVGLSSDGNLPASHYWCSFIPSESAAQRIEEDLLKPIGLGVQIFKDENKDSVLNQLGLKTIKNDT